MSTSVTPSGLVIDQTGSAQAETSKWVRRETGDGLAVQVETTGTVACDIAIEATNDLTMTGVPQTEIAIPSPAGSATQSLDNIGNARSRFYRAVVSNPSGSGTLKVAITVED